MAVLSQQKTADWNRFQLLAPTASQKSCFGLRDVSAAANRYALNRFGPTYHLNSWQQDVFLPISSY